MRIKLKKIPENIFCMSSLSSTWPSNHSNNKFKQKPPKVPKGPELGKKQWHTYTEFKKTCICLLKSYMSFKCLNYTKNKAKVNEHSTLFLKHSKLISCPESIMYNGCNFKKTHLPLENIYFNIVGIKIHFQEVTNLGKISKQIYKVV